MVAMNLVIVSGNLTKDPEILYTPKGNKYANIRIAINNIYKSDMGEKIVEPVFITVKVWGKQAENTEKYLVKGRKIMVSGELRQHCWKNDNNEKRSEIIISANEIQYLDYKKEEKNEETQETTPTSEN